ncbi:hypothetical protein ACFOEK_00840 [Litoribrevibacter euphylliae]|uniref:DUF1508 domain-containing protein n=1 Tax=Litoribrevibacter euphylliae TaxID=1834034 RepID=A0ABV7H717_9GAMM
MAYQVISKSNNTFWLMTSNGNWISSHHSRDEAVAACQVWFKCSPIVRHIQDRPVNKMIIKQKLAALLLQFLTVADNLIKKARHKNNKRQPHELHN